MEAATVSEMEVNNKVSSRVEILKRGAYLLGLLLVMLP